MLVTPQGILRLIKLSRGAHHFSHTIEGHILIQDLLLCPGLVLP